MEHRLPTWLRWTLILGICAALAGVGTKAYLKYAQAKTLKIAVANEGQVKAILDALSKRLKDINARVQLEVIPVDTMVDASKAFEENKVDLALLRADYPGQGNARTVIVATQLVALMITPGDTKIEDFDDLKGKTIGVIQGDANKRLVDAIVTSYSLDRSKFKNLTPEEARKQIASKQIQAVLSVTPITESYLKTARDLLGLKQKQKPGLIAIEQAGAIANTARYYESYELPKGTLWGSPPVPDEEMTTLRVPVNVVAQRRVPNDFITELTKAMIETRGQIAGDYPILAQIRAPSTDKDAFIPLHPGAAIFYEGNEKTFFEKYGDAFFYGPMLIGLLASALAGLWKFLGIGAVPIQKNSLTVLAAVLGQVREAKSNSELTALEDKIDAIVQAELVGEASGVETGADPGALSLAVSRCEKAIDRRRESLREEATVVPA